MKIFDVVKDFALTNANKLVFNIKANSPTILLVGGIASIVGGTVLAVANTEKASKAMDEFNEQMDRYHKAVKIANTKEDPEDWYPTSDRKHHVRIVYGHMIMSMAKIYLPVVILEAAGIGMICKSHSILSKRNAALGAAYAALQKSYDEYRKRVREKYGEEADEELFYGVKTEKCIEKITSENGVTTEEEKEKTTVDPLSPWSFFIDETCDRVWEKDPHLTLNNLIMVQRQLNDMAYHKPFVTLNDLYWLVGHKLTDDGMIFGWNGGKDAFIDLGIFDGSKQATRRFVNGLEDVILLTPNIDGNIYQMSKDEKRRKRDERIEQHRKAKMLLDRNFDAGLLPG